MVHTGDGKGKSTAGFGMAIRAAGQGMRVVIVQFLKGNRDAGELHAFERFPEITVHRAGEGFTWEVRDDARQAELAAWGMDRARDAIADGVDLLILDEVNIALAKGFFPLTDLLAILADRPAGMHVCCTGRNAPGPLMDAAQLVTEMRPVKHPWDQGIVAQRGIEF
ncbi:MAG: cob(I)yrinic acid a,c-diamide adenosyltransferase [Alphaproteobacteria bacterium]|nr:cob(I)yrinic acid a,c-diamide adenosyltransferase [Alphaproteobacteria bacterium]